MSNLMWILVLSVSLINQPSLVARTYIRGWDLLFGAKFCILIIRSDSASDQIIVGKIWFKYFPQLYTEPSVVHAKKSHTCTIIAY